MCYFPTFFIKTYNLCYLVLQKLAKNFNFIAVALKKKPFLFCSEVFFILSTFLHIIDFLWNNTNIIGHQNGWLFDFAQVRAIFFPGKNRIRKFREKIRISNFSFFGQIFRMDNRICCFMVNCRFFLAIQTNFDIFDIMVFNSIDTNSKKVS